MKRWVLVAIIVVAAAWLAAAFYLVRPRVAVWLDHRAVEDACRTAARGQIGVGVCVDAHTFQDCDYHRTIACRGDRGCVAKGPRNVADACDVSKNTEADTCPLYGDLDACSPDGSTLITCVSALEHEPSFARFPCRGPSGCTRVNGKSECDTSVGRVGERCRGFDAGCSEDGKAFLRCDTPGAFDMTGVWSVTSTCRGPKGCVRTPAADGNGFSISCSSSVAEEGDACQFEGLHACRMDGEAELVCRDKRQVVEAKCHCVAKSEGSWSSVECGAAR